MKKLVIQIPCFNEAETLPDTLAVLPRNVDGFDAVEVIVIDDGSTDETEAVARRCGADRVVRLRRHVGLARAFAQGLEAAVAAGASVIVNTDADNQYCADDIPTLTRPILAGRADIVIGARPMDSIPHFSREKRLLQRVGSWVVRKSSGTDVADAASGFRAFSRQAAMQLKVFNDFSYTIETIIQAGYKGLAVVSVPVRTNPPTRPSRLFRSSWSYVWRQTVTILRIFVTYRPFPFFAAPGAISFGLGLLLGLRFLIYYLIGQGMGKVQSLILAALLLGLGVLLVIVGLIADLVSVNRQLLEGVEARLRLLEVPDARSRPDISQPGNESTALSDKSTDG
jgi:glycosyltransferase involved in cell wall biosynthesis